MCGIAGIIDFRPGLAPDRELLAAMTTSLAHRGPDGYGYHVEPGIGFGHRRLSIVDLAAGKQPMYNEDDSVCIVFNGEIYNFPELYAELESLGHRFRTRCDTEVIVHAWEQWGTGCLSRLNGMFAFAIWDRNQRKVFIARDRLGVKPLYYCNIANDQLLFGSELKALELHPELPRHLSAQAVEDYLAFGYIPDPATIYRDVHKLEPGCSLLIDLDTGSQKIDRWWDLDPSTFGQSRLDAGEAAEQLVELLRDAVRCRLLAEVPLGAFLSGGVDSSAVVALMAGLGSEPVRTCAISFDDPDYDESSHARAVADRYRTDHSEHQVAVDDFGLMEQLVNVYDEPYADSSAIPTYRVCEAARRRVTVALSGDGGDEAFAGYRRYRLFMGEESIRQRLPQGLRSMLFGPLGRWYPKLDWAPRVLRGKTTFQALARDSRGAYLHGISLATEELRTELFSGTFHSELQGYGARNVFERHAANKAFPDPLSMVQYLDFKTYLPGDILTKVDRASMAHSLEVRGPFLDYRLVEWAATLPPALKLRGGVGKRVLKESMEPFLPRDILYRKKMGFAVPLVRWFRGPLAGRVRQLSRSEALNDSGILNGTALQRLTDRHLSGRRDHSQIMWALLMLEQFLTRHSGHSRNPMQAERR